MNQHLAPGCYACDQLAASHPPPREAIVHTEHWRVAHAFNSALLGWLIVLPTRHLTSYAELSTSAADELGGLLRHLAIGLESLTGCVKTYQMQLSEAEGFAHLHVHLVPRMADQPDDRRGPDVFGYLGGDETAWLPEAQRDTFALDLRDALAQQGR